MQHQRVCIKEVAFKSYLHLSSAVFAALGVVLGAVGLLARIFGVDIYAELLPVFHIQTVAAGLMAVVVMPLFFGVFGLLAGALSYFPFHWVLRFSGGLTLHGTMNRHLPTRQQRRHVLKTKRQPNYS